MWSGCDYIPLQSGLNAFVALLSHRQKVWHKLPLNRDACVHVFRFVQDELDKELEKRGHRYVRYADDFSIYVKSTKSAKRVGNSIFEFLRDKLQLPINREKSGIRKPLSFQVLGFGFVPTYKKGEKGKYQLVVKPSKWKEFKAKLKYLTKKTTPASFEERVYRINLLIRGWINYFRPASIQAKLKKLEEWLRNRLRYCIWHHWRAER